MLSICIPRYNYDPSPLIAQLRLQMNKDDEIIVIDDASTADLPVPISDQFIPLQKNIGRAAIRNRFLEYAKNDWLLFLDNDVEIINDNFLQKYIDCVTGRTAEGRAERGVQPFPGRTDRSERAERGVPQPTFCPTPPESFSPESFSPVIYGGRIYSPTQPDQQHMLRWKYGRQVESQPAAVRKQVPYTSFQTNNFLVHRSVLSAFPFDESIKEYGYEDLLFAEQLRKSRTPIIHMDNPVRNIHLETNEKFLELTEMAMRNLNWITEKYNIQTRLMRKSWMSAIIPKFIEKKIYNRLLSGSAGLWEFQLWKAILTNKYRQSYS